MAPTTSKVTQRPTTADGRTSEIPCERSRSDKVSLRVSVLDLPAMPKLVRVSHPCLALCHGCHCALLFFAPLAVLLCDLCGSSLRPLRLKAFLRARFAFLVRALRWKHAVILSDVSC